MNLSGLLNALKPRTIQSHLLILVSALVATLFLLNWLLISNVTTSILKEQFGKRALHTAQAMASMPALRLALIMDDPQGVQTIAEDIRKEIGAAYVVVADETGKRYSHPVPERIGQPFVGGDTGPALSEGKAYVSEAVGTLGPSMRSIVPILGRKNEVVGFVSVGYLTADIHGIISSHLKKPMSVIGAMAVVGFLCAVLIAEHLKKITLGLEPAEIASLYLERGAVLEAIREAVVAVDGQGAVRLANKAALAYAGTPPEENVEGRSIEAVLPGLGLDYALNSGEGEQDLERTVNGQPVIVNTVPIRREGGVHGAVASFRRKDELDHLARELSRVKEYTELLRVQTHEYSNKLHTIAGLIQIGALQEALDLVAREATGYQDLIRFLRSAVPDPAIAAIIMGKYGRARELKIELEVDPDSSMTDVPEAINREGVVTILGNLLDNAFEAVLEHAPAGKKVALSFTDLGQELVFEVEDNGPGVPADQIERIFLKGVSAKGRDRRGLGLYLVHRRLDDMGGSVTVTQSPLGGALFTVAIPKQGRTQA